LVVAIDGAGVVTKGVKRTHACDAGHKNRLLRVLRGPLTQLPMEIVATARNFAGFTHKDALMVVPHRHCCGLGKAPSLLGKTAAVDAPTDEITPAAGGTTTIDATVEIDQVREGLAVGTEHTGRL